MNLLKHQNYKNENGQTKNLRYDWLINCIYEHIKNSCGLLRETYEYF